MSGEPRVLYQEGAAMNLTKKPGKQRRLDYSPMKSTLKQACSYWTCRKDGVACGDKQKIGIIIMFCMSCIAFVGAVLLWTTDIASNLILSTLVIKNETQLYDWWKDPPVETSFTLRVFNYTNSEAYLNGTDKKLRVVEIGPYVYRLRRTKAYVEFDEDEDGEIVTFQDNRTYEFLPEKSIGVSEDDLIIVPNLPLLGSASVMHDSYYIVRMGLATILKSLKVEPFVKVRAGDFFWGYDDPLFNLAKNIVPSLSDVPFDKFGMMASITGVSRDRISIHTGLKDRSKLGVISSFNGEDALPYWNGYECNRVDGSEGSIFPLLALPKIKLPPKNEKPETVENGAEGGTGKPSEDHSKPHTSRPENGNQLRLTVFNYELCRRFPIVPSEEVEAFGFPAIRFRPPEGVFDDAVKDPTHKCFCDPEQSICPPSGVFNATPCAYGGPIMGSFPHFYGADKSLLEPFEGLNPVKELHEFSLDIQPILGVPLGGKSRLQLNAMVRKGIWQLNGFPKNLILPIAWFEIGVENLPEEVMSAIRMVTHTMQLAQKVTQWLLLGLSIVLMVAVIVLITKRARAECPNRGKNLVLTTDLGKQEEMAFLGRNG